MAADKLVVCLLFVDVNVIFHWMTECFDGPCEPGIAVQAPAKHRDKESQRQTLSISRYMLDVKEG